jgi:hypothetical protein
MTSRDSERTRLHPNLFYSNHHHDATISQAVKRTIGETVCGFILRTHDSMPTTRAQARLAEAKQWEFHPSSRNETPPFPQFSKFPKEIRLMVWEAAIEPRIVHVQARRVNECPHILRHVRSDKTVPDRCDEHPTDPWAAHQQMSLNERVEEYQKWMALDEEDEWELDARIEDIRDRMEPLTGLRSDCPIPSLLLACRESFSIASKVYTRSFSSFGALPQIYFNFQLDTLHIDDYSFCEYFDEEIFEGILDYMCPDELAKIENLSLTERVVECFDQEDYLCDILSRFGNVRNLYLTQDCIQIDLYEPGMSDLDRAAELKFFEPEDIHRRSYMFQHPEHHLKHQKGMLPCNSVFNRVDNAYFDLKRTAAIAKSGRSFPRPYICSRILASATLKANYEAHKRQYETLGGCRCYEHEMVSYIDDTDDSDEGESD